jgi:hypothetical protein
MDGPPVPRGTVILLVVARRFQRNCPPSCYPPLRGRLRPAGEDLARCPAAPAVPVWCGMLIEAELWRASPRAGGLPDRQHVHAPDVVACRALWSGVVGVLRLGLQMVGVSPGGGGGGGGPGVEFAVWRGGRHHVGVRFLLPRQRGGARLDKGVRGFLVLEYMS